MTREEAKAINREFYRYMGGGGCCRPPDENGRFLASATSSLYPGYIGYGLAADHVVAQAYAYRNLQRRADRRIT